MSRVTSLLCPADLITYGVGYVIVINTYACDIGNSHGLSRHLCNSKAIQRLRNLESSAIVQGSFRAENIMKLRLKSRFTTCANLPKPLSSSGSDLTPRERIR